MADYLLIHENEAFARLRPVLADAYGRRSFRGLEPHLGALREAARAYARSYYIDPGEIFLLGVEPATRFSRAAWRTLVGELLVVTAAEMPELPGHLESLDRLLPAPLAREALRGCADLTFGLATYRPGLAGYNSVDQNKRLLGELRAVDPSAWSESMLVSETIDPEEAREELLDARDGFVRVVELYERVVRAGRVIVFEDIHG
jgi:hypothetical protein